VVAEEGCWRILMPLRITGLYGRPRGQQI